ncbi:MAG: carboxylating nicotinate-nucleotide diphosphorylase [Candidatus Margulisbacteria bacterium]|jgi:nicotinate-nucleotide pyrophosphorylase (carboxylating)|nr:carboxylating nicotinate-nucleotide diphosphorylase [Candidatus Margulisiibacteriota bacterium]
MIKLALAEDVGPGDITTRAIVPAGQRAKAVLRAKQRGVIAGLGVAKEVFRHVDPRISFKAKVRDGAAVKQGAILAVLSGPARGILTGERVALNFLQHLSGIATLARTFSLLVTRYSLRTKMLDTRKTTPGLRLLEKYAVRCGGGVNHRLGLHDAILIKDNHIKLSGGIGEAIFQAKKNGYRAAKIEVEAKTLGEVRTALEFGVGRILLDNMGLKTVRQAVQLCRKAKVQTEASGGVTLKSVRAIAQTGVDYISVGALTHSAPALDISLKVI